MSYETANGANSADASTYTPQAEGQPEIRVDSVLMDAEDIVRSLSEPPDPVMDSYRSRAKRCELRIFDWLWRSSGGLVSSESSIIGTSISYNNNPAVRDIVRDTMGEFALGSEPEGGANVAYFGRMPI